MSQPVLPKPKVVSHHEWEQSRKTLLEKEKQATRMQDALAAERRRLPMMAVDNSYPFETSDGLFGLQDLFENRSQLIVYHHMLKSDDPSPCPGCCMFVDNLGDLSHLHARDTTLALVAAAPHVEIESFKQRMGWDLPWYSTTEAFNTDFDVTDGSFGLNVFIRFGDDIFRTYHTSNRGVETLGTNWGLLDVTPRGRQEVWEDSPDGWPQESPYSWWRLHDEY